MLSQFPPSGLHDFGQGLNLRDQPEVVSLSQAIDALNVTFTERGGVKQRPGYIKFTASELTNRADSMVAFYKTSGTRQLVAGCGTRLEALNTSGAIVASATGLTGGPWSFARFGTPNAEYVYAGNGTDTLRRWDGTSWTAPTATVDGTGSRAMPKGRFMAVDGPDNRIAVGGFATTTGGPNGVTSSPSHVFFSNPGLPETYASNDYVQLRPGDGEAVTAVVTWHGQTFIFKSTMFGVMYGVDTEQDGSALFNIRSFEGGVGCDSPRAVAVGRDGVYFLSRKGVYRTQGGEPQLLSDAVRPIFYGNASAYFGVSPLNHGSITACAMAWHDEQLYVSFPAGTATANTHTLVFSAQHGWWSIYDLPCAAMASFRVGNQEDLMFAYSSGTKDVGRHATAGAGLYTSDNSTAIVSRWRSGWSDFGLPRVKKIRSTKFWGTGACRTSISTDHKFPTQTAALAFTESTGAGTWGTSLWGSFLWGPLNAVEQRLVRRSQKGHFFSIEFTNTTLDQIWAVYGLVFQIQPIGESADEINTYSGA